jgi:sugar-specific transcriptional regulator TrmB
MLSKDLEKLGLNKNQAKVYLALFDLGKSKAGEIITKTGLHRHLVYQALEELVKQRLAAKTTQGKIFLFQATDPTHFLDNLREQNLAAENLIDSLKERGKVTEQNITIYEGNEGIRAFSFHNAENIKPGEWIYIMASGGKKFEQVMGTRAVRNYFQKISDNGGGVKILMYQSQKMSEETLRFLQSYPRVEISFLPDELAPSAQSVITQYSVGFTIFEEPSSVIEVQNKHLAEAYIDYFNLLWNQEVEISRGQSALHHAFYDMADELGTGGSYDVLGAHIGLLETSELKKFFDDYHAYRIKKGVNLNMLSYKNVAEEIKERFVREGDKKLELSHIKALQTRLPSPMQANLYNGKTTIILSDEKEPIILRFKKPGIYAGFKSYFDELWNQNSWTFFGEEGLEEIRQKILTEKKDIYLIGANQSLKTFNQKFHQQRVENQIRLHLILQDTKKAEHLGALPMTEVTQLTVTAENPITTLIFGDYTAQIIWTTKPTIFLLNDPEAAEKHMTFFKNLK